MERQQRQAGFGIAGIIIAIGAVGVIGTAGWVVYRHTGTKLSNGAANQQITHQETQQQPTTTPSQTTEYLTIKEWGVKVPLRAGIKDAYYAPAIGSSRGSDGEPNTMLLGLKSLDSSGCAATNTTSFAGIFRALPTETDSTTGKPITQEYPDGVTIGNYFYAFGKFDAGTCKASQETLQSVDAAFLAAQESIVSAE